MWDLVRFNDFHDGWTTPTEIFGDSGLRKYIIPFSQDHHGHKEIRKLRCFPFSTCTKHACLCWPRNDSIHNPNTWHPSIIHAFQAEKWFTIDPPIGIGGNHEESSKQSLCHCHPNFCVLCYLAWCHTVCEYMWMMLLMCCTFHFRIIAHCLFESVIYSGWYPIEESLRIICVPSTSQGETTSNIKPRHQSSCDI